MADTPYKRTDWNEIIQDVNSLATNPDAGCDPLETIEEVEEDHIWTKDDVIEVQDKLKEICPDNEFAELEEIWLTSTIDEIEDAIAKGWCECEPELDEWVLGQWVVIKEYGESKIVGRCGGKVSTAPLRQCEYTSPCYDTEQYGAANSALWVIITNSYREAFDNCGLWIENRRNELLQQRLVEDYADLLRIKREQLIALQTQLAACQSNCGSIQAQITTVEAEILELENIIQEIKNRRDDFKSKAEDYLIKADAAAIENWTALAALKDWEPAGIQVIEDHIKEISSEWGLGNYPYNRFSRSTWKVNSTWWLSVYPTFGNTTKMMYGHFTPSGFPFSRSGPFIFGSDWWYSWRCRGKCTYYHMILYGCTVGDWLEWGSTFEGKSSMRRYVKDDKLELKFIKTDGSNKVGEYNPDPDQ